MLYALNRKVLKEYIVLSSVEKRLKSSVGGSVEVVECRVSGEEDSAKVEKKHCGRNHNPTEVVCLLVLSSTPQEMNRHIEKETLLSVKR